MSIAEIERKTQNRIVKLFVERLGYTYLGDYHDRENSNIEEKLLHKFWNKKGYSEVLCTKALRELSATSKNVQDSLYDVNKAFYSLLRYGSKNKEDIGSKNKTIQFIDWENIYNNDFYIAEEVTVVGENTKRPDIVVYINGIAIAVIELKRSTVSVSHGIRQNLDNQSSTFIKQFFTSMQLICAGNDTEGLSYGTIKTKEKYYLKWKEDKKAEDKISLTIIDMIKDLDIKLDKDIVGVFHKERLCEILFGFIAFDRGEKKLCRPNQYFGIKAAQIRIKSNEGGIIWHSQGSGKSLTMVWLSRWIKEFNPNARILVITDRDELDKQIEKVYKGVDEDIVRTKSGADLIHKLNSTLPCMIASLVHKFGNKGKSSDDDKSYDSYIDEIKANLPTDFKSKGDFYVFVDECHRTQSGKLHDAMKAIIPDALFVGFTGTPLMKKDKQKSIEVFGSYIHTYKFDEAVKDGVVLDLRYEAKDVEQYIVSQEKIDEWFEATTRGLTEVAKTELKKYWGTQQQIYSSKTRLAQIAKDIYHDMRTKDRLQNGRGNAILVASDIYQACKYYELFQQMGFKRCAIVTSYTPNIADIKGEAVSEDEKTDKIEKYEIYQKMLNGKSVEDFETEVKKKFIEEPAQMKLLIVVDKLLTGFDAPPATYLYIDKSMRDHGLFQAICRVNRLDGEDKEYGYIVDYKDSFLSLEKAMDDYTKDAFDSYDKEDVEGLLKDRIKEAKEHLEELLESLYALCEPVEMPREDLQFLHYFCRENPESDVELKENEPKRTALYKLTSSLIRAYAEIANEIAKAGYTRVQADEIKEKVLYYKMTLYY